MGRRKLCEQTQTVELVSLRQDRVSEFSQSTGCLNAVHGREGAGDEVLGEAEEDLYCVTRIPYSLPTVKAYERF